MQLEGRIAVNAVAVTVVDGFGFGDVVAAAVVVCAS